MNEAELKVEAEQKVAEESAKKQAYEKAQSTLKEKSTEDLINIINDTRSEARDRRIEKKEIEDKLNELKTEQKAKEESILVEDGKLQELIDAKTKELSDKDVELASLKLKADEMTEFKASIIDEAKAELGDKWLDGYASLTLSDIDKLVKTMSPKISINTDKGVSGEITKMQLTDAEKKEAYIRYSNLSKERAEEFYKHNLLKQKERDKK